jgi:hypothetical protein
VYTQGRVPRYVSLGTALAYLAAGRSVVPIALGVKAPSLVNPQTGRPILVRWEHYQERPATPGEVRRWFSSGYAVGLGLVTGPVSGITLGDGMRAGLEVLDIDDPEVHARFVTLMAACDAHPLLERLVCEETPRGGRHYGYCCVEWAGSTTLARCPSGPDAHGRERFKTLIEVKGEGGQCVVAPTPAGVYPDHAERGYTLVHGDWTRVPLISPKARRVLRACAQALG